MFFPLLLPSTTLSLSPLSLYLHLLQNLSALSIYNNHDIFKPPSLSLYLYIFLHIDLQPSAIPEIISLIVTIRMDMSRTTCFYFFFIVFVILSRTCLCDSRRLGPSEKKLGVNHDHLIEENDEETTKLEVPSTKETKTFSSEAPIEHAVVNHGQINGKRTKDDSRVKRASVDKTVSSKIVSRNWKVPKYSKKQPRSDQEHPGFNLDYMQPTTHPPHHN